MDSHIGPFERLFRLANVTVTTASAAGPLRIHGLDRATARTLVDDLIRTTQATPGTPRDQRHRALGPRPPSSSVPWRRLSVRMLRCTR